MKCLLQGPDKKYSETVRAFALTLHFFSPRGYNYVREKFNHNLPHVSTIRRWYLNDSVDGEPGMCRESFISLKALADKHDEDGTKISCALIFDEMHIRKHLQWSDTRKKFLGTVNYGFNMDSAETLPLAKNALVFMLIGINVHFTMPIAFYFINDLNSEEKANLLHEIILAIVTCNARVLSVTFDGLSSNIPMCESLGASFTDDDFRPYFESPADGQNVYVILDPSHMEKLARNCIASQKKLFESNSNNVIEWKYFEKLEELRETKNFEMTHKLNKTHMQWDRAKMNVRLAVETLSNSVADAMQYLMENNFPDFKDCGATIKYIRVMNNLFDVMNTKKLVSGNNFKSALNADNKTEIFKFFQETDPYLRTISLTKNKKVIDSNLKTSFCGFIINMVSLKLIYEECVESGEMTNFPTFRLSQDHVESFFGRIRSLGGFNDNPTVEQFCSAFRKVVINNEITSSHLSNCLDNLNILFISSRRPKLLSIENENDLKKSAFDDFLDCVEEAEEIDGLEGADYLLEDLSQTSVAFIAGTIEKKIEKCWHIRCVECLRIFYDDDKIVGSMRTDKTRPPSKSTFKICLVANQFLKIFETDYSYSYNKLLNKVLRSINFSNIFPKSDFTTHEGHKYYCVKFIAEEFIRIKCNFLAKQTTLKQHRIMMRKKLTKVVHYCGQ